MAEVRPVPSPTDRPPPPPPPPPVDRRPPDPAVLRQKLDTEVQGRPVDRRAETSGAPTEPGRAATGGLSRAPTILDATGRPVGLGAPLKDSRLDRTFAEAGLRPVSEPPKPPGETLRADLDHRLADAGVTKGLSDRPAPVTPERRPGIEGQHPAGEEAAAAKAIKDATKLDPADIAAKAFGRTEFSHVELKQVLTDAGVMAPDRRPLSEPAGPGPDGAAQLRAPTAQENRRAPEGKAQQAEAERREHHPNLRDAVQQDSERLSRVLDPSGRQGVATGLWETLYRVAGFTPAQARAKAENVDAVLSLAPVAERGAATNRAWDGTRPGGTATARPAGPAGSPEVPGEAPPAGERVLPKGMSVNEVEETHSRDRYHPAAVLPGAKQHGVDLVDGRRQESWGRTLDRNGEQVFVQTLDGGTWIQIKKLDPENTAPGAKQGPLELRVRNNVNDAVAGFEDVLQDSESRSNWKQPNDDGIRVTSVLTNPDHALVHIEVPGFDQLPPARQELLRAAAREQLGLASAPVGALSGDGTLHGVPIDVRVVDRPMPGPLP